MQNQSDPAPRRGFFWGRAALATAALAAYAASMLSGASRCAFAAWTQRPCPACGGTRAMRAILRGDVSAGLRHNPVAPAFAVVAAALALRAVWAIARDGHLGAFGRGALDRWLTRALVLTLVAEVVVWAARFAGLFGGPVSV
ncbi:MAG: DUF2752 domain-containing protein [Polyangiales bacterium]